MFGRAGPIGQLARWQSGTLVVRRYRLTVRTEPSQGLNTGSIPVSATNCIYNHKLAE